MPSSSPASHVFRYEPALCTLTEGQTLADWRRGGERPASPRRTSLRARLLPGRVSARRRSAR